MKRLPTSFQLFATDLSNHLACEHLTQLNRRVALNELKRPGYIDPSLAILIQRGKEHEEAYAKRLEALGKSVVNLAGKGQNETLSALQQGVDVVAQAYLESGDWAGHADFLVKVPGKSKFGNWAYEVQDTKLAQNTRAQTLLQLCLYSDLLAQLQGSEPGYMAVVKPGEDFPTDYYRYSDFKAFYRMSKARLQKVMQVSPMPTYPEPAEHCNICAWWKHCDNQRHADDYLSLVAGIRALHIEELKRQGIETLEAFAKATTIAKPERGNLESYLRKQEQASIQWHGRAGGKVLTQQLPIEKGRGFNRLPEPNAGDVYFDIEGDMFFENGGLEYLLGYVYREETGKLSYQQVWARNRKEEKEAFSTFMQFIVDRWKRFPGMYIYHFAPYEPTTVKRLARVHAVFEQEVDTLLRAERFIDLHTVFKEALLASVERYSLKELEKFTDYKRNIELHQASVARKQVEVALEIHDFNALPKETLLALAGYNEDDCMATESLHRWLEGQRAERLSKGDPLERPALKQGDASENVQQQDTRAQALFNSLISSLPEDNSTWTDEHHAKWLLAHQIDYFRREDKSAWWEYFRVHELEHEDLLDERKAITGLKYIGELPKAPRERNPTHRYQYPPQEISIDVGDELIEVKGEKIGTVKAISLDQYTIDIKKAGDAVAQHPIAVHTSDRVDPGSLATALLDFAQVVDEYGLSHQWPNHAAKDLLMRRKPQLVGGQEGARVEQGESVAQSALRSALNLDRSFLAIQGPPGTGKTFTAAKMILELHKAGKKIGITAVSHKVIRNLIDEVIKASHEAKVNIGFVHKVGEKSTQLPDELIEADDAKKAIAAIGDKKIVGGTAWLWADSNSNETLDFLFVDEAGQMSLSHVLAASRAAHNLILLGDPQQLEQPQKGAHPEGSDVAALAYILSGHATMPEGYGLFLGTTHRLHPNVCEFTSELFYEGKLHAYPGLEHQVITGGTPFDGAGLFYLPVEHKGNQNKSNEEIQAVVSTVDKLLKSGSWTDSKGVSKRLTKDDVLIVAPYNAQVSALMEKLPDMRIGTVDKFQGQQAPVVIYSMTSSSPEDAPRGMSFLYSPNRLNVATSRAKCICILVASPKLMEPDCRTIDQMKWANALCRYVELSKTINGLS